jgi:hypothetical protein
MAFERVPRKLSAGDTRLLRLAVARDDESFAPRLAQAEIDDVKQPFFRTRILDVTSPVPTPSRRIYVAWPYDPQRFLVLTGHIEHLNEIARADLPTELEDPKRATEYMQAVDAWTTASTGRELHLASFADIPWWETLDAEQTAQIEDLRQRFEAKIEAEQLYMVFPRYELRSWRLIGQTLVERTLAINMKGEFARTDTVHARGLPVPPGRIWGEVNGRFVPVG